MNQVQELAWHTATFRTLNEARRIEPDRAVNGAMWELMIAGYANLMTLGIRGLVDKDLAQLGGGVSKVLPVDSMYEPVLATGNQKEHCGSVGSDAGPEAGRNIATYPVARNFPPKSIVDATLPESQRPPCELEQP